MKTLFLVFLISFNSFAACDFKTGIKEVDGQFVYSKDCHLEVGRLVKEEKQRDEQVGELKKAIELKDLALDKADQRVMLWRKETYEQHKYLERQQTMSEYQKWIYFGLGVAVSGFAVWGAGQLK